MNMQSVPCPCCRQAVAAPSIEIIIDHFALTPLQGRILGAVWRAKGRPVPTARIFDAMYVDHPEGGPSVDEMYKAFKVSLCRLRKRLSKSGINIENVGYARGYHLVMETS